MALRTFANGVLFAEILGNSPPTVLALHGRGRRGSDFAASLGGMDVLAPDFPGFGASPAPSTVMGAADYATTIEVLLDEFTRPPLIVGHSFGGRVAVCLAARHPGRVGALVLTGVPLVRLEAASKPRMSFRIMRSLNRVGVVSDARMEDIRRSSGSSDYRAASGMMRDIFVKVVNESYEAELAQLEAPTRLVWGSEDQEVPVQVAERALEILAASGVDATLEVVTGSGHMLPTQEPETLRRVVDSLMKT